MKYLICYGAPGICFVIFIGAYCLIALHLRSSLGEEWTFVDCFNFISLRNPIPIPPDMPGDKQTAIFNHRLASGIAFLITHHSQPS